MKRQAAPLREQVVDELRQRIVSGEMRAGERLKERFLIEKLRVSRTVIREALRQLETENLVRVEPQVGPLVAELSADQARQLYEIRAALEGAAARLAAAHRTEEQLNDLRRSLDAIESNLTPLENLLAAKRDFYNVLILASNNGIIGQQLEGVQARISQLRRITLSRPGRGRQTVDELRTVVEAIAAKNESLAYSASVEHVNTAAAIAMKHLNEIQECQ